MKTSAEILGLPVISITEGRELGMSKTLLIDAKNGAVAAITIEDDDWYRGVKLIPFESVIAVGADAITITNSENIGTKAITKGGTIQGSVSEIYIGDDGKVVQCEISDPKGNFLDNISAEQISIFGKQVTVIDSASVTAPATPAAPAPEMPAPSYDAAPAVEETPAPEPVAEPAPAEPAAEEAAGPEPLPTESMTDSTDTAPAEPTPEPAAESAEEPAAESSEDAAEKAAAKATEDRHRRFLLNKKASRRITTDTGVVIVEAGGDITEEVLQKAKLANKIIELSMNVQ